MAGANTYFGRPPRQATPPPQTPIVVEDLESPVKGGNIFGQPLRSPWKKKFQEKMTAVVASMQDYGVAEVRGRPEVLVTKVADSVHQVRKEKREGLLPDNQQWKELGEMLDHERFVLAAVSGLLTPKFLANANKNSLQQRVTTLNGLSENDFQEQMGKSTKSKDPEV